MDDAPLRQRVCRTCGALFAICRSCDRGHAYCSPSCQGAGRQRSVRAAKARHRGSDEGRLDHRDHQRAYRAHRRVRDHTSLGPPVDATLLAVGTPRGLQDLADGLVAGGSLAVHVVLALVTLTVADLARVCHNTHSGARGHRSLASPPGRIPATPFTTGCWC
jgi:hypothetical protein